jgi:hypothetical protein
MNMKTKLMIVALLAIVVLIGSQIFSNNKESQSAQVVRSYPPVTNTGTPPTYANFNVTVTSIADPKNWGRKGYRVSWTGAQSGTYIYIRSSRPNTSAADTIESTNAYINTPETSDIRSSYPAAFQTYAGVGSKDIFLSYADDYSALGHVYVGDRTPAPFTIAVVPFASGWPIPYATAKKFPLSVARTNAPAIVKITEYQKTTSLITLKDDGAYYKYVLTAAENIPELPYGIVIRKNGNKVGTLTYGSKSSLTPKSITITTPFNLAAGQYTMHLESYGGISDGFTATIRR